MNTRIVTITVLELIAELGKFPLEAPVILTADEKGQTFLGIRSLEMDPSGSVILWCTNATADQATK